YVRTVVLDAHTHKPITAAASCGFVIAGPKGDQITSGYSKIVDSVAAYEWLVPDGQPGGRYTVEVQGNGVAMPAGKRGFEIRAYRAPRLNTQIEFVRDGYGPGDDVVAILEASRAEGGVPAGAAVDIVATVDGIDVYQGATEIDAKGYCEARFELPNRIETGDGTLTFVVRDGGVVETAAKTIPILLQTLDISMYPEGGDLVAGLTNYVYLEARTPARKPADIAGAVLDSDDNEVTTFRTVHEGRGRFAFMPRTGESYRLRIDEPAGIERTFDLPKPVSRGVVLHAVHESFDYRWPVVLELASTMEQELDVRLYKREKELTGTTVTAGTTPAEIRLDVPPGIDGVLTATVFNAAGRPIAERLVFRQAEKVINVSIEADRKRYVPGDKVELTVRTTGADGKPVSTVVGMTVTDETVLEMIDKREQAPRLPVMVFLDNDVRDLADAHVYLDSSNPDSPRAVDLLLGTQGWRRFAVTDLKSFISKYGNDARRVLAQAPPIAKVKRMSARFNGGRLGDLHEEAEAVINMAMAIDDEMAEQAMEEPAAVLVPQMKPAAPPAPFAVAALVMDAKRVRKQEANRRERGMLAEDFDQAFGISSFHGNYVTIRQYAHPHRPQRRPDERTDFTETLYWHAGIRTDATTGEVKVQFALSDSVTSFTVAADAFDGDGVIGSGTIGIESVRPFYIEPKLPLEVTAGDRIRLPVAFVNGTSTTLTGVRLTANVDPKIRINDITVVDLQAGDRGRGILELPVDGRDDISLTLTGTADAYRDQVTRHIQVVPRGFPMQIAQGGKLEPDSSCVVTVTIPESVVPGSISTAIVVYPAPLANLTDAVSALLREPHGCFEQTSSTNYPVVMAQQYFETHAGIDPQLVSRGRALLDKGYKRLTSFECNSNGYEWFGQAPAHEALSAYGLLQFTDMAEVYAVDASMVGRTTDWVMAARDGAGGFKRERRALHTWIQDRDCSDAYITWSLLQSGMPPAKLLAEIDSILKRADAGSNSYVTALGANVALASGNSGVKLLDRLAQAQAESGVVDGATTSIVGSSGISLQVETTALAVLAWLQADRYTGNVESGIRWIAESCKAGRYGSTQSTVLALRAIMAYDKARAGDRKPGAVSLYVDGRRCGTPVQFDSDTQTTIELTDVSELMSPGKHTIELRLAGGSSMPCSVAVQMNSAKPDSSEACLIEVTATLNHQKIREGELVNAQIAVRNRSAEAVPNPVAIIGIPGGLEVRHDQLKELVDAKRIAAYEVIGRDVVLYWRSLQAKQIVELPLDLIAAVPGTYTGPASRAYLYYGDEHKHWSDPLTIEIAPRQG
ncbi:MAG TPA: A-macroglobulin complement component, partial [Lentisphaeria bacterium]|nr:A-macroglobulin complement component [Lentisphaeria bacterium]